MDYPWTIDPRLLGVGPDIDPYETCPVQYRQPHKRHVPHWWPTVERRIEAAHAPVPAPER